MSGMNMAHKHVNREDRIADFCMVHPLNTWLWLILCLTPTVLYQMSRCLSIGELLIHLGEILASDKGIPTHHSDVPEGRILMPDRHSVVPASMTSMRKYMEQDHETGVWKFKDPATVCILNDEKESDDDVVESEVFLFAIHLSC